MGKENIVSFPITSFVMAKKVDQYILYLRNIQPCKTVMEVDQSRHKNEAFTILSVIVQNLMILYLIKNKVNISSLRELLEFCEAYALIHRETHTH